MISILPSLFGSYLRGYNQSFGVVLCPTCIRTPPHNCGYFKYYRWPFFHQDAQLFDRFFFIILSILETITKSQWGDLLKPPSFPTRTWHPLWLPLLSVIKHFLFFITTSSLLVFFQTILVGCLLSFYVLEKS